MKKIILLFVLACCQTPQVTEDVAFKPEPKKEPEFGIVIVNADSDQPDIEKSIELFCKKNKCSIGLLLGDKPQPNTVKSLNDSPFKFEKVYKNLKLKFYYAGGSTGGGLTRAIEKQTEVGPLYYSIDGKWIELYALDTDAFASPVKGRKQRDWLRQTLQKSTATWKIIFGNDSVHPQAPGKKFSFGHYIKPMLKENKVDFFISGHESNKELVEHDGTKFVVNGRSQQVKDETALQKANSPRFAYLLLSKNRAIFRFVNTYGELTSQRVFQK